MMANVKRFKMYKKGKFWVIGAVLALSIGGSAALAQQQNSVFAATDTSGQSTVPNTSTQDNQAVVASVSMLTGVTLNGHQSMATSATGDARRFPLTQADLTKWQAGTLTYQDLINNMANLGDTSSHNKYNMVIAVKVLNQVANGFLTPEDGLAAIKPAYPAGTFDTMTPDQLLSIATNFYADPMNGTVDTAKLEAMLASPVPYDAANQQSLPDFLIPLIPNTISVPLHYQYDPKDPVPNPDTREKLPADRTVRAYSGEKLDITNPTIAGYTATQTPEIADDSTKSVTVTYTKNSTGGNDNNGSNTGNGVDTGDNPGTGELPNTGGNSGVGEVTNKIATITQATDSVVIYDGVNGTDTGKRLNESTDWQVYRQYTDDTGAVWYNLGGNQWIQAKGIILDAIPGTYKKLNQIGTINDGASASVYTAPGISGKVTTQTLWPNSSWHISASVITADHQLWYRVGTNQWVKSDNIAVGTIKPFNGVAKVNYVPGYGIAVWSKSDGTQYIGRKLADKTSWKVFAVSTVGSHHYYNLGGNQWVDGAFVKVQATK